MFIRIDDRLIHGQVVEGWVNYLKADTIFVADDVVAANDLQCSIMEIATPRGLKVCIGGVEEICKRVQGPAPAQERAILLFASPSAVLRALDLGLPCSELNVGGMHYMPGKRKLVDVLAVDEQDLLALRQIRARGVKVTVQAVPTQKPLALERLFAVCRLEEP